MIHLQKSFPLVALMTSTKKKMSALWCLCRVKINVLPNCRLQVKHAMFYSTEVASIGVEFLNYTLNKGRCFKGTEKYNEGWRPCVNGQSNIILRVLAKKENRYWGITSGNPKESWEISCSTICF